VTANRVRFLFGCITAATLVAAEQPESNFVLAGTVVNASTGEPVGRALVELTAFPAPPPPNSSGHSAASSLLHRRKRSRMARARSDLRVWPLENIGFPPESRNSWKFTIKPRTCNFSLWRIPVKVCAFASLRSA
jgi:hypothetical protein